MRRAAVESAPRSLDDLSSSQRRSNNNQTRRKPSGRIKNKVGTKIRASNAASASTWFVIIMMLFVIADVLYLYRISNNALQAHEGGSSKNISEKKTYRAQQVINDHRPIQQHQQQPGQAIPIDHSTIKSETKDVITDSMSNANPNDNIDDKQRIFDILYQAGVNVTDTNDIDQETIDKLPTWKTIQTLFGTGPRILGLERCEEFRNSIDPTVRFFGIAGTFNTGTNLLAELMIQNCQITERMEKYGKQSKGIRWQVPWGKHFPATRRGTHVTKTDKDVPHSNSLPLVTIRDPYVWMQSMCRHRYAAYGPWKTPYDNNQDNPCPHILNKKEYNSMTEEDIIQLLHDNADNVTIPVSVHYSETEPYIVTHQSLPHLWNDWYSLYVNGTFPRIIVRFEDLLFYGQEVTEKLCKCGGGVTRTDRKRFHNKQDPDHFVHISDSAKLGTNAHGKHKTDLVGALIKYSTYEHRLDTLTNEDLITAKHIFDTEIMNIFGYTNPTTTT